MDLATFLTSSHVQPGRYKIKSNPQQKHAWTAAKYKGVEFDLEFQIPITSQAPWKLVKAKLSDGKYVTLPLDVLELIDGTRSDGKDEENAFINDDDSEATDPPEEPVTFSQMPELFDDENVKAPSPKRSSNDILKPQTRPNTKSRLAALARLQNAKEKAEPQADVFISDEEEFGTPGVDDAAVEEGLGALYDLDDEDRRAHNLRERKRKEKKKKREQKKRGKRKAMKELYDRIVAGEDLEQTEGVSPELIEQIKDSMKYEEVKLDQRLITGLMSVSGNEPVFIVPKRRSLSNDGQEIAMIAPKRRPVPESESNARPMDPLMKECSTCHQVLRLLDHFDPRNPVCRVCEQKAIQHAMQVAAESEESSSDDGHDSECLICSRETFEGDLLCGKCPHAFHQNCIIMQGPFMGRTIGDVDKDPGFNFCTDIGYECGEENEVPVTVEWPAKIGMDTKEIMVNFMPLTVQVEQFDRVLVNEKEYKLGDCVQFDDENDSIGVIISLYRQPNHESGHCEIWSFKSNIPGRKSPLPKNELVLGQDWERLTVNPRLIERSLTVMDRKPAYPGRYYCYREWNGHTIVKLESSWKIKVGIKRPRRSRPTPPAKRKRSAETSMLSFPKPSPPKKKPRIQLGNDKRDAEDCTTISSLKEIIKDLEKVNGAKDLRIRRLENQVAQLQGKTSALQKMERNELQELKMANIQAMQYIAQEENDRNTCRVCLVKRFDTVLKCGHVFCKECLSKCRKKSCPICRKKFTKKQQTEFAGL